MIGEAEQNGQHANVYVGEITDFLAQHGRGVFCKVLAPLEQHDVERLFGPKILTNERFGTRDQLLVVHDGQLHIEDRRFFGAGLHFGAGTQMPQTLARFFKGNSQTFYFRINFFVGHQTLPDFRHLPSKEVHWPHDNSG